YRAVKMKVGWEGAGLRHDAERVRAVRAAIGPEIDLMVDVNNAWDATTALRFARSIEREEPYWLEEPTPADDYRGQAMLCASLDMPVASGENEFTRWGFRDLIAPWPRTAARTWVHTPSVRCGVASSSRVTCIASRPT
ncbi:MAG: hypothetical protein EBT22_13115, partial [Chloroflexi bacterium]|nr:hypothetical protein [Chloroflexota bacterium]